MDFKRKRRRRKKNSGSVFFTVTLFIFLFILLFIILISYISQKNKTKEAMSQIEELENYNQQLFSQSQVENLIDKTKKEFLDKLKSMVENGDGMLSVLQYFYPDYVIASSDGSYHFFPISESLAKNDFHLDYFTYPVYKEETKEWEGTASYTFEDGKEAKKGVDVSTFQGDIDWKKVKNTGMDYAMIRLGFRGYESGKIVLDSKYEENIENCIKAGLDAGVYFFTEALTEGEAIEEADFVIENLKDHKINMPVVIDVEESANKEKTRTKDITKEQRTKNVIAFCERIKEAGYDVMIYGNLKSFMIMMEIEKLEEYDKWFAYYRYPFHFPYKIKMWQYTAYEKVDGIDGKADVNLLFY